jgi:hypothetical protein
VVLALHRRAVACIVFLRQRLRLQDLERTCVVLADLGSGTEAGPAGAGVHVGLSRARSQLVVVDEVNGIVAAGAG